jgi:hypothetical protein
MWIVLDNNTLILYAVEDAMTLLEEGEMEKDTRWEPLPGLGVHEQISKVVEDFVHNTDQNLIPGAWVPIMDLPKLRPN